MEKAMGSEPTHPPTPADQARVWRANLPHERRRRSDLRGTAVFGLSAVLYVLLFLGQFWLPYWWLRLADAITLPVVIGALFVIGHDAAHGSLVCSGWLNRVLGRLCFLPAWHPYTSWSHAHNSMHHGWTNFKGREPAFPPFTKEEFDRLPLWRQLLERAYRTPLGIGVYYTIDFYGRWLLFPLAERRSPYRLAFHLDRIGVFCFIALQFVAAWILAHQVHNGVLPAPLYAVIATVVPWFLWISFMGFVSFIQHTHPRLAWYDREDRWSFYHVQLTSTTHTIFPPPVERLLHNIMDHPAHHIDPTIPLYELTSSQKLLEQMCPEHAVVIRWTPWDYFRTCAACKLYDFRRDCWTDFHGKPTTPLGLSGLARSDAEAAPVERPARAAYGISGASDAPSPLPPARVS
jgi:acyl-lipid omega-6 desaturase (Delta-12 desaturase)